LCERQPSPPRRIACPARSGSFAACASHGTLGLHATSDDGTAGADDNLGVATNDGYYFADGFEDRRL
jgi:hypothetical protein